MNIKKFVFFAIFIFVLNLINNSYCPIFGLEGFRKQIKNYENELTNFTTHLKDNLPLAKASLTKLLATLDLLKPAGDELSVSTPAIIFFKSNKFLPEDLEIKADTEPIKKTIRDTFSNFIENKIKELKKQLSDAEKTVVPKEIQEPLNNLIAIIQSIEGNLQRVGKHRDPMRLVFTDLQAIYNALATKPAEVFKQIGKESSTITLDKINALMPVAKALDELLQPSTTTKTANEILRNFFFDKYDSPQRQRKAFFWKYKAVGVPATEVPVVKDLIANFNELETLIKQLNESKTIKEDEEKLDEELKSHEEKAIAQNKKDLFDAAVKEGTEKPIYQKVIFYATDPDKLTKKIDENKTAAANIVYEPYKTDLNNIINTAITKIESLPNANSKTFLNKIAQIAMIKQRIFGGAKVVTDTDPKEPKPPQTAEEALTKLKSNFLKIQEELNKINNPTIKAKNLALDKQFARPDVKALGKEIIEGIESNLTAKTPEALIKDYLPGIVQSIAHDRSQASTAGVDPTEIGPLVNAKWKEIKQLYGTLHPDAKEFIFKSLKWKKIKEKADISDETKITNDDDKIKELIENDKNLKTALTASHLTIDEILTNLGRPIIGSKVPFANIFDLVTQIKQVYERKSEVENANKMKDLYTKLKAKLDNIIQDSIEKNEYLSEKLKKAEITSYQIINNISMPVGDKTILEWAKISPNAEIKNVLLPLMKIKLNDTIKDEIDNNLVLVKAIGEILNPGTFQVDADKFMRESREQIYKMIQNPGLRLPPLDGNTLLQWVESFPSDQSEKIASLLKIQAT